MASGRQTHKVRPGRADGFTLIELLVVIAIIALLVSILLPSLHRARQRALTMVCATNLRSINLGMEIYLSEHRDTYPCAQDPVSTSPFYWLWMGRGFRELIGPFIDHPGRGSEATVLFCPSDPASDKFEATSYAYAMSFYHSPEQINRMNSSADTYSNPQPFTAQRRHHVARPGAKIVVGEWTSNHVSIADDAGWWCWDGSRTYLFADGAVRFLEATQIRPARDGMPNPNLTIDGIRGQDYPH